MQTLIVQIINLIRLYEPNSSTLNLPKKLLIKVLIIFELLSVVYTKEEYLH